MSPFEPVRERPRWEYLYETLRGAEKDQVFTYAELIAVLDDGADKAAVQSAVRRAARELAKVDNRAVDAVRGVGYRVVRPEEHVTLAKRQQRKSGRALQRSHDAVTYVDLAELEPQVRNAVEVMAVAISMQQQFMRNLDIRQNRIEQIVASHVEKTDEQAAQTNIQVAELERRLAELETSREAS